MERFVVVAMPEMVVDASAATAPDCVKLPVFVKLPVIVVEARAFVAPD